MDKSNSAKFKELLLNLFFPKFCFGCQKEGDYLCLDCRHLLEISEYNYCLCEKPQRLPYQSRTGTCLKCQNKNLSGLYFALSYKKKPLVKHLIRSYKYSPYIQDLSGTFASILIEHFVLAKNNAEDIWQNSVLVPVPLDITKLKSRGYNQSTLLAKDLSQVLQIPVIGHCLYKTKQTQSQMTLKKEQRKHNLSGAFAVKNKTSIAGKKVFLVDDIYTIGATLEECAKVLKNSGAKKVWGITIAREEYD